MKPKLESSSGKKFLAGRRFNVDRPYLRFMVVIWTGFVMTFVEVLIK